MVTLSFRAGAAAATLVLAGCASSIPATTVMAPLAAASTAAPDPQGVGLDVADLEG